MAFQTSSKTHAIMSNSQFCIQQRQKERRQLKKLLIFGFASSTVIHGVLAYLLRHWSFESSQVTKEPIEMIIVDKPKPKPKPKVETKPIVKPKPTPVEPQPVQAQTSPPKPVKPPESTPAPTPIAKAPEPTPKKVLSTPTPAPKPPTVPAPVEKTPQPSSSPSSLKTPENNSPDEPNSSVATDSAPPSPETTSEPVAGISCIDNCEPEYPSALNGVEGSAGVKLTIDRDGNVIGAELVTTDSNSQVNRQALLAARKMQFSPPGNSVASVRVKIDFTVEGSEYDRARREEQERREQAKKEREEAQQAQEQLEREQAREQQQESTPPPLPEVKPSPTSPEALDEERLRKFKERMENYRQQ